LNDFEYCYILIDHKLWKSKSEKFVTQGSGYISHKGVDRGINEELNYIFMTQNSMQLLAVGEMQVLSAFSYAWGIHTQL